MNIKLMDVNNYKFDSTDNVGFSFITLAEIVKGKSDHNRHEIYKKFLKILNKSNYHIYLPKELDKLNKKLLDTFKNKSINETYEILDNICDELFKLAYVYYSQIISLLYIICVHVNNGLQIINNEIPRNNSNEHNAATFSNWVHNTYINIENKKDTLFNNCCIKWEKDCGDLFGNKLFHLFQKKYCDFFNLIYDSSIKISGKGKDVTPFGNLIVANKKPLSEQQLINIYNAYFTYRINDNLTKSLFIPYIHELINNDKRLEFNHILDAFLIFNVVTIEMNNDVDIINNSNDTLLSKVLSQVRKNISNNK